VIVPLIVYSQKSDSGKLILVPKHKLERLLQSHFYTLPACDSTVIKMSLAIDTLNLALERSKELTSVITLQRDNKIAEVESLRGKARNDKTIHDKAIRSIKRQKLNMTFIAVGEALLIVILLL